MDGRRQREDALLGHREVSQDVQGHRAEDGEAYRATEDYGKKFPKDTEWLTKYSYFDEIYKGRKKLPAEYVVKEGTSEVLTDAFLSWFGNLVYEGKLKRGENVRKLVKIFAKNDKDAIAAIEKKGIDEAWKMHGLEHPEETNPIYNAIEQATVALENIKLNEFDELRKDDARVQKLKNLKSSIEKILQYTEAIQVKHNK